MGGFASVLYGSVAYTLFLGTILYAIAFVGNLPVPKTIDSGDARPAAAGADRQRRRFSPVRRPAQPDGAARLQALVDAPRARSRSSARPTWCSPASPWCCCSGSGSRCRSRSGRSQIASAPLALQVVFWAGWGLVFLSTFLINHFELFGLRQVWCRLVGKKLPPPVFRTPSLYKRVRHPLYLGFLLAFWSTPVMTMGHLLFAVATTGYILIAIQLEERDLIALFGERYRRYREQVSMLIPLPWRRARHRGDLRGGCRQAVTASHPREGCGFWHSGGGM